MPRCRAPACHAFLQGANISTLQTCLGGVQNALRQIRVNNNNQAAQDISAVSGPCSTTHRRCERRTRLPLRLPRSRRDPGGPDVLRLRNKLGGREHPDDRIERPRQLDGNRQRTAQPPVVGRGRPHLGPRSRHTQGPFQALLRRRRCRHEGRMHLGGDVDAPGGPFIDRSSRPLECQKSLGGSIDPSVFVASDGTPYLVWKSGGPGSSAIWSQQLDAHRQVIRDRASPTLLLHAGSALGVGHGRGARSRARTAGTTISSSRATTGTVATTPSASPAAPAPSAPAPRVDETDPRQRGRHRRAGRRVGLHRRHGQLLHRLPHVGAGCRRLPEQPGPLSSATSTSPAHCPSSGGRWARAGLGWPPASRLGRPCRSRRDAAQISAKSAFGPRQRRSSTSPSSERSTRSVARSLNEPRVFASRRPAWPPAWPRPGP